MPDRLREGYGPNTPALLRLRDEGAGRRDRRLRHDRASAAGGRRRGRARCDRHRSSRGRAAAAARRRGRQSEPARRGEPARRIGGGRGRLSAGRRGQPRAAPCRLVRRAGRPEPDLLQWLDLVALGTVCDVVPLAGLNRALVAQGIKVARRRGNPGLAALAAVGRASKSRSTPIISALCSGRGSMPADGSAPRISAPGCSRPTIRCSPPNWPARLDAVQPGAPRHRGAHLGGRDRGGRGCPAIAGAGLCRGRELAPRGDRHCRRAPQGALRAPGLRRRARRRHRQGLGPLGRRAAARPGGHRGASGGAADQRRRPCDGGGFHGRGGTARRLARISGRAAGRRASTASGSFPSCGSTACCRSLRLRRS